MEDEMARIGDGMDNHLRAVAEQVLQGLGREKRSAITAAIGALMLAQQPMQQVGGQLL
jgi:hypothetical protein